MITKETIKAHAFALEAHGDQMYGKVPYSVHLTYVVMIAIKFIHNIKEELREGIIQACWTHDVTEDACVTYSDINKVFGEFVAEVVYAVSNEKGKNRKERNERTLPGIAKNRLAVFVKLCDKIANTLYSKQDSSGMHAKYSSEFEHFKKALYIAGEYDDMWEYLEEISFTIETVKPVEYKTNYVSGK
ncbi:MAG: phosphohydrolase [bacterium]|nr:phosphohydrolase [bacterium]